MPFLPYKLYKQPKNASFAWAMFTGQNITNQQMEWMAMGIDYISFI